MPSPFPGMDPYLEAADIWPDFHNRLASHISSSLNLSMPAPYYARLEMRSEAGIVEEQGSTRRISRFPSEARPEPRPKSQRCFAARAPPPHQAQFYELAFLDEFVQHHFVEVRDASRSHKLITLIEIVSPSNKWRGPDRESYRQKQREILASDASLVEIDLLRTGARPLAEAGMDEFVARLVPPPDYLVVVNRAWQRGGSMRAYQVFPASLREPLPCFPTPFREQDAETPLDLQFVVNRAYEEGSYRRGAVDYSRPPEPPLSAADAEWAAGLLKG